MSAEYPHLTVQVCASLAPWGRTAHLKVRRRDGQDGISWDQLQQVKNDLLGEEVTAIEIYPAAYDLVDEAPIRHLWAVPAELVPNLNRTT